MTVEANDVPIQFRQRLGLFLVRSCTTAWIGAASLFVVVGVTEVTRGGFDSTTKDILVAIRFPAFYVFGLTLISLAWIGTWLAGRTAAFGVGKQFAALAALGLVLLLMGADYFLIYHPLLQMVTPPGQVKSASFTSYHEASKWINLVELLICCVTSLLVNWPTGRSSSPTLERILK